MGVGSPVSTNNYIEEACLSPFWNSGLNLCILGYISAIRASLLALHTHSSWATLLNLWCSRSWRHKVKELKLQRGQNVHCQGCTVCSTTQRVHAAKCNSLAALFSVGRKLHSEIIQQERFGWAQCGMNHSVFMQADTVLGHQNKTVWQVPLHSCFWSAV